MKFELAEQRSDHPLEGQESIKADICLYTGPEGSFGDPVTFRVDTAAKSDAPAIRERFNRACELIRGTVRATEAAQDASVCETATGAGDGLLQDGIIHAYFVSADKDVAKDLAANFDEILGAIG